MRMGYTLGTLAMFDYIYALCDSFVNDACIYIYIYICLCVCVGDGALFMMDPHGYVINPL